MATRKELLKEAQAGYKEINYRFSLGGVSYSPFQELEADLELLTGAGYVNRRKKTLGLKKGNLSRLNKADLQRVIKLREDFLLSPWSTPEGRKSIIKNAYTKFSEKKDNEGVSESNFLKIIDITNSGVFSMLKDLKNISSDIVVKLGRRYGFRNVNKILTDFMSKHDVGRMSRTQIEDLLLPEFNE